MYRESSKVTENDSADIKALQSKPTNKRNIYNKKGNHKKILFSVFFVLFL